MSVPRKLELKETRPTYIANVYRPPDGDVSVFIDTLEEHLINVHTLGISDVVSDVNVDLLTVSVQSKKLKSFLYNSLLKELVSSPTRVTNTSKSLIDHVYVSNDDFYSIAGTTDPGLSDHFLVYTCRKRIKYRRKTSYFEG